MVRRNNFIIVSIYKYLLYNLRKKAIERDGGKDDTNKVIKNSCFIRHSLILSLKSYLFTKYERLIYQDLFTYLYSPC